MQKYTTGELARLCSVTVRTVQYYDDRGVLSPSELSEGGRRLYTEEDLRRFKIICFLRELGFSLDAVRRIMKDDPEEFLTAMLEERGEELRGEISERQAALSRLDELRGDPVPFFVLSPLCVLSGILLSVDYARNVSYLCPLCHTVFAPRLREIFFARHTIRTRYLRCPQCERKCDCIETYRERKK